MFRVCDDGDGDDDDNGGGNDHIDRSMLLFWGTKIIPTWA